MIRLEYRYMQLIEHANPDDDAPADNVCAQISDEEDSDDEVQFKSQSRTKKIMDVVRKAIGKVTSTIYYFYMNVNLLLFRVLTKVNLKHSAAIVFY